MFDKHKTFWGKFTHCVPLRQYFFDSMQISARLWNDKNCMHLFASKELEQEMFWLDLIWGVGRGEGGVWIPWGKVMPLCKMSIKGHVCMQQKSAEMSQMS